MTMQRWTRRAVRVVALAVTCGSGVRAGQAEERAEAIFRDARDYTVRIRTQITTPFIQDDRGSYTGAGFLVDSTRRWVLTNAHVVGHSPSDVTIAFVDGNFRPARKLYVDSFTDVAILEAPADGGRHPTAPIDCDRAPEVGEAVGAFGHPLGMAFTGSRGIVSGKTTEFQEDLLQIDATVDQGNSGGPVIALRDGRIVGIATAMAGDERRDRLNFATPMKDVCRILELMRNGAPPDPPLMEFSLLIDEDDRHTLRVGATHNPARWPFEPGDSIMSVGREHESVSTVTQFVTAMRGRTGIVPVRVRRAGRDVEIQARPIRRPSVIAQRGVTIDGALVAPAVLGDPRVLSEPVRLMVHSVESGSDADALGLSCLDLIHSIDGRRFDDLDSLLAFLRQHQEGPPLRVVFRRVVSTSHQWFGYHVRDLPGKEIKVIESEAPLLTGKR